MIYGRARLQAHVHISAFARRPHSAHRVPSSGWMEDPSGAEGSPGCLPVKGPSAMWTEAAEPQSRVTERVHSGGGCCEREIEKKKEPGSPQGSDRRHQRLRLRLSLLHLKWVRLYSTPASSTAVEKLLCLEVLLLFHAAAVPFSRAQNHKKHCHEFLRKI